MKYFIMFVDPKKNLLSFNANYQQVIIDSFDIKMVLDNMTVLFDAKYMVTTESGILYGLPVEIRILKYKFSVSLLFYMQRVTGIMKFKLENSLISLIVQSKGAEIISLKTKKNNLEYIWEADPEVWPRHAPLLFPIVGKLKNNTFTYQGQTYNLPQHGFARDKDFKLLQKHNNTISLITESDTETLKNFPFPFQLITSYTLEGSKVIVHHEVINPETSDMYFSIGAHPGFRCPLLDEKFDDYYLEFEAEEDFKRHKIKESLLHGETEEVNSEGKIIPLSRDLFKEDALVFKGLQSKYVAIKNKKNEHLVKVSLEGFPFLGIWTKLSEKATFICIEPWLGIADHFNFEGDFTQKEGILKLEGQKHFSCSYNIIVE